MHQLDGGILIIIAVFKNLVRIQQKLMKLFMMFVFIKMHPGWHLVELMQLSNCLAIDL